MNQSPHLATTCVRCGFQHNCYCDAIPTITSDLSITLLTHPNETSRATNTGQIVKQLLANTHVDIWQRKGPIPSYIASKERPSICEHKGNATPVLVFPSESSVPLTQWQSQHPRGSHFILLDATWQEARKMLNRSEWLQALPQVSITPPASSQYQLRRNQQSGNLCTFEVVAQMINELESDKTARTMLAFFKDYLARYQAERCGHRLDRP
ncbi:DTW domain-containing protein [Vibrio sp. ZSDZ65]|uniref:tRNA-uridine aminocarboxypropyltransferase n=1 Tax=Vibrio qingdaonensis TaxID=2829491 RepID=A0A9X3HYL8_9VIBR|nr:tRNA-uridine aminocarboxypropyltransferase [Vibrio qingdaonensis]MCW8348428.1 DTW domain-containing protein [Vibrio qingdaonensis]